MTKKSEDCKSVFEYSPSNLFINRNYLKFVKL